MASTMGALHLVENHRVVHAHLSTLPVGAVPLAPVIDLVEVEVAEDEAMAVAATFEIEIETATLETHETASATFETRAMDRRSGGMSIATMVDVGTVSSTHEQIA